MSLAPARGAAAALAACVMSGLLAEPARGWGFDAHRIITESAAAALPGPLGPFYQSRLKSLSGASIEPDSLLKRRDGDLEDPHHYLDLDELSRPPFDDIPPTLEAARARFGKERLDEAGLLPWRVDEVQGRLAGAFAKRDWKEAVRMSGWLSHYVADAYQPLHTTRNHDGQHSGNHGVHAAFETDLIGRSKPVYRERATLPVTFAPRAIEDPSAFILKEMRRSFARVPDVLRADSAAMLLVKKQGKDFFEVLEERAGELAGAQMREAAASVASLWFSAWTRAGAPALPPPPAARSGKKVREEKP